MLTLRHLYAGVPNSTRGQATHLSADPTDATDNIAFPSGRVAAVRSISDPLSSVVFTQHTSTVTCARYAPNGELVASGDDSGMIRLWVPATALQKTCFDIFPGPVYDIAFSSDGKYIVAAGECRGAFIKLAKVPSGASAGVGKGHTKRAIACDMSSKWLASGCEDMSAGLFKGPPIREFDTPKFLSHHTAFVNDVRFSPNAALLAIASSDRTISIVDVETQQTLHTLSGHTASVTGICWMSDDRLASSANDKTVRLWTIQNAECIRTFEFGSDVMDMQIGITYVKKTNNLVSASLRPQLNVLNLENTDISCTLRGHCKQIVGLAGVGRRFYTADYSGLMVSWDLDVGASDIAFNGKGPATSVCAVAANHDIVANIGQDGKVFITPVSTLTYKKPVTIKGGGIDIAVAYAASSELSAIVINELQLAAINPSGDNILAALKFDRSETGSSVAVSPDGSQIAVGIEVSGGSGELRFYTLNGDTFKQAGDIVRSPTAPNKIAFSPDGDFVAVGEKGRRMRMYNCSTRQPLKGGGTWHTARIDAICFSPDGTFVATGGMDGSIAVWPVGSDKEPVTLMSSHRNGVTGIAYATAECIVTSGGDSCVKSWSI